MGNCFDNNIHSECSSLMSVDKKRCLEYNECKQKKKKDVKVKLSKVGLDKIIFFTSNDEIDEQITIEKPILQKTPEFNQDLFFDERKNYDKKKNQVESTEESPPQLSQMEIQTKNLQQLDLSDSPNQNDENIELIKTYQRNSHCSEDQEEMECLQIIKKQVSNQFELFENERDKKNEFNVQEIIFEVQTENHCGNNVSGCEICKQVKDEKIIKNEVIMNRLINVSHLCIYFIFRMNRKEI